MRPSHVAAFWALSLFVLVSARAQSAGLPAGVELLPDDLSTWLGLSLDEAEARLGEPAAHRFLPAEGGLREAAVADYARGLSLYAYDGLVWQVRLANGYQGSIYGIFVGDGEDKVISTLGTPWSTSGQVAFYRLAWKGYPVRLRIVFESGIAREIYLYRGDF